MGAGRCAPGCASQTQQESSASLCGLYAGHEQRLRYVILGGRTLRHLFVNV